MKRGSQTPLNSSQAFNYALRLLNQRNYTEATLRQKLALRAVSPADIQMVITQLYELKLLNDAHYAQSLLRTESLYRHSSQRYIAQKMCQKGVPRQLIEETLAKVNDDIPQETERARYQAERYQQRYQQISLVEAKQKIARHLYTKGFSSPVINTILQELSGANLDEPN